MGSLLDGPAVLAGLCGAGVGVGVLLIAAGVRPVPDTPTVPWTVLVGRARRGVARRRVGLAAFAAADLAWVLTGWPVAAATAGLATALAPRLRTAAAVRRQLDRLEALEAWTRRLADLLGSGAGGLTQAIDMSVRTCPTPIAPEVQALALRLRTLGPEPALRAFADDLSDLGSPAADLVAAALILRVRRGGRGLRPVLEALAGDVADLVRARREIEADRAKPRSNVRMLIAITALVLGATVIFARSYLAPFSSPIGQVMLTVIIGIFATGTWLLGQITRTPTAPRILRSARPEAAARAAHPAGGRPSWT